MNLKWHHHARAFADLKEIHRSPSRRIARFIPARPAEQAIELLSATLGSGKDFLVHEGPERPLTAPVNGTFLTLTGGTSGQPKVIRRSQASWVRSFSVNRTLFHFTREEPVGILGSLAHSLSLYGLLEALHLGLVAYLLDELSPHRQRHRIRETRIKVLYATPTQLRLLTRGADQPCPDVRLILVGGGQLDAETEDAARRIFPRVDLRVFYGAAETSFVSIADTTTPRGSVGRAYPGVTLDLRDDAGNPTRSKGEIWVRSPYLFDGYVQGPSGIARDDAGFISVGEIGALDPHGNLTLLRRKDRMIQIADRTVHPETVESLLLEHPAVRNCAVLPVADSIRGRRLVALVETDPDPHLEQTLRQLCRDRLGPLAAPRYVRIIPALPVLASGKVDLRKAEAIL